MNFTVEEWALLNPFQKNLYRAVVGGTIRKLRAVDKDDVSPSLTQGEGVLCSSMPFKDLEY
jgi:hypothetical protein